MLCSCNCHTSLLYYSVYVHARCEVVRRVQRTTLTAYHQVMHPPQIPHATTILQVGERCWVCAPDSGRMRRTWTPCRPLGFRHAPGSSHSPVTSTTLAVTFVLSIIILTTSTSTKSQLFFGTSATRYLSTITTHSAMADRAPPSPATHLGSEVVDSPAIIKSVDSESRQPFLPSFLCARVASFVPPSF